jgi:general secretion pathway protein B
LLKQVYGDGNGPATLDDLVDAGGEPSTDEFSTYGDTDSRTRLNDAAVPAASNDSADEALAAAPAPAPAPAPPPAATPAPAPARPAPVTSVERVQLDPAPAPQVPRLSEMPPDYRAAFPTLSLDVHSYDSASKKRFIMISGKRYNEGDALQEGPRIVQIVPEGVIFDFRGEQVLFTIAH